MQWTGHYQTDAANLAAALRTDASFDILQKELIIGQRRAGIAFIDGFTKAEIITKLLLSLVQITPQQLKPCKDIEDFTRRFVTYVETATADTPSQATEQILAGQLCLWVDGWKGAVLIDAREYPVRGITEPEDDRILRGARDGFCETMLFNATMIRRRIRDPRLTMEALQVGEVSRTDVVMCYMEGMEPKLVEQIRRKLRSITIPALNMTQESLSECLVRSQWYNPFPRIRYTERPDAAAAAILEGRVLLLIDNTPSVMILPTGILDFIQNTNDYYFPPIAGTYLRLVRSVLFLATLLVTPVWYMLIRQPDLIPPALEFLRIKEPNSVPILAQLLVVEVVIDGIKLASLNTPGSLSNAFGLVGALLLGEFAVNAGLFVPEVLLYMAFIAIGSFAQPSFELTYAFKLFRILFLILTAIWGLWGLIGAGILMLLVLVTTNTAVGKRYLYPVIPFNGAALLNLLFRRPLTRHNSFRRSEKDKK